LTDFVWKNSVVVECSFTGGFSQKGVLDMVFLWSGCVAMRGKDGHWDDAFWVMKIMQEFEIILLAVWGMGRCMWGCPSSKISVLPCEQIRSNFL